MKGKLGAAVFFAFAWGLAGIASGSASASAAEMNCPSCGRSPTEKPAKGSSLSFPLPGCSSSDASLKQAEDEYRRLFPADGTQQNEIIGDEEVAGTATELAIASRLLGKLPPSKWKAGAQMCRQAAKVAEVKCALRSMWMLSGTSGTEASEAVYRIFSIAQKTGYPISLSQYRNAPGIEQLWSAPEIRKIEDTLDRVPPQLFKLPTLTQILRLHDRYVFAGKDSSSLAMSSSTYGDIVLRRAALPEDREFSISLVHELGHFLDFATSMSAVGGDFANLSGWQRSLIVTGKDAQGNPVTKTQYTHLPGASFVSIYAATSPYEDLAESIAYYVLDPITAQVNAPEKYALLKSRIFGDKEFVPVAGLPEPLAGDFRREGEYEAGILACLKSVVVLGSESRVQNGERVKGVTYFLNLAQSREQASYWIRGSQALPIIAQSGCLQAEIERIAAAIAVADGDAFCRLGGKEGIAARISSRVALYLEPMLSKINQMTEAGPDPAVLACRTHHDCREIRAEVSRATSQVFQSRASDSEAFRKLPAITEEALRLVLSAAPVQ